MHFQQPQELTNEAIVGDGDGVNFNDVTTATGTGTGIYTSIVPEPPPKVFVESTKTKSYSLLAIKESDAILAETMNRLSINEREQVYEEIHGVSDNTIKESPEFIQQKLIAMDNEISIYCCSSSSLDNNEDNSTSHSNSSSSSSTAHAYQLAFQSNPEYCQSPKFRLMYLRAHSFDPKKAALYFIGFFQMKLDVFGPAVLAKEHICQSDLNEEDISCLNDGGYQLLPFRDKAGRAIIMTVPYNQRSHSAKSVARAGVYTALRSVFDDETQRNGIVIIAWRMAGPENGDGLEKMWNIAKVADRLPLRFSAIHVCLSSKHHDNIMMKTVLALSRISLCEVKRIRVRGYVGTVTECIYQLMSFGIPTNVIPFSTSHRSKNRHRYLTQHEDFLKRQRNLETMYLDHHHPRARSAALAAATTTTTGGKVIVIVPGNDDVLMVGRACSKNMNRFPGNVKFRAIIESYMDEYDRSDKPNKTVLSAVIVSKIKQEKNSKFLKREDMGWVEISDDEAREKVTHSFRNFRMKSKYKTKQSSSTTANRSPSAAAAGIAVRGGATTTTTSSILSQEGNHNEWACFNFGQEGNNNEWINEFACFNFG